MVIDNKKSIHSPLAVLLNIFSKFNSFSLMVVLSLVFGFLVGISHSTWQYMVANSQMVSGVVSYSENHPWYVCIMQTWTIWDQLGAIFLVFGGNERTLSILISGAMGAVFFLAFSTFVYALCNDIVIAVAFPFLMHFLDLDSDFGVTYPIQLLGSMHSHGVLGQGFAFLILALFCAKQYRLGGFLLGILPSMHVVVGGLLCLTLFICFMWGFKSDWPSFVEAFKYFILGLLITITSLLVFFYMTDQLQQTSQMMGQKYIQINAQVWDIHRSGGGLLTIGSMIATISFLFSLSLLVFFQKEIPDHAIFPLRIMVVAGTIGGMGCVLYRMPFELVNSISPYLISAMPSRWVNINVLGIIPLFVGLSAYYKKDFSVQLNLGFFVIALALILTFHPETNWGRMCLGAILFSTCGLLFLLKISLHKISFLANIQFKPDVPRMVVVVSLLVVMLGMSMESIGAYEPHKSKLLDWTNDEMFKTMQKREGYILMDPALGLLPLQLYTKSPVFPANLTPCLSYTPILGPMVERYMKNISGIDILNPSAEARKIRGLPIGEVRSFWQSKTLEQWQVVRMEYGITQIFTLSDWELQLPVLYGPEKKAINSMLVDEHNKMREYIVYKIPG